MVIVDRRSPALLQGQLSNIAKDIYVIEWIYSVVSRPCISVAIIKLCDFISMSVAQLFAWIHVVIMRVYSRPK